MIAGLPIDVMQMLLAAAILRSQIREVDPSTQPKVIILLADSMAIDEGGDREVVYRLITVYKQSLDPLVDFVKLKECSEIVLSSEVTNLEDYKEIQKSIEEKKEMRELANDKLHYAYVRTQSAITHYMWDKRDVGIKIGWLYAYSNKERLAQKGVISRNGQ